MDDAVSQSFKDILAQPASHPVPFLYFDKEGSRKQISKKGTVLSTDDTEMEKIIFGLQYLHEKAGFQLRCETATSSENSREGGRYRLTCARHTKTDNRASTTPADKQRLTSTKRNMKCPVTLNIRNKTGIAWVVSWTPVWEHNHGPHVHSLSSKFMDSKVIEDLVRDYRVHAVPLRSLLSQQHADFGNNMTSQQLRNILRCPRNKPTNSTAPGTLGDSETDTGKLVKILDSDPAISYIALFSKIDSSTNESVGRHIQAKLLVTDEESPKFHNISASDMLDIIHGKHPCVLEILANSNQIDWNTSVRTRCCLSPSFLTLNSDPSTSSSNPSRHRANISSNL